MLRSKVNMIYRLANTGHCCSIGLQRFGYRNQHFWVIPGKRLSVSSAIKKYLDNFRWFSGQQQSTPSAGEEYLTNKLKDKIPNCSHVEVHDVSGGCGEMYEIYVVSTDFKGITVLAQHKMVTDALKEDIPKFHGIRVATSSTPPPPET
ncbi:bolA-like protein 3 [Panonychus citri]|uniref:bolA-like protein 3 n=1 Tax=Panonychus citri TaxID=50023 RepID=UPI0023081E5A|nr:bolA-like protein 3 [Panonychus citri]